MIPEKDLLELSFYLSSLTYVDHYFERSLEGLLRCLKSLLSLSSFDTELLTSRLARERLETVTTLNPFICCCSSGDVDIRPFYKSEVCPWRRVLRRRVKPAGIILRVRHEVIIAFRGTTKWNFKSTLNNLNAFPGRSDRVSGGFSKGGKSIAFFWGHRGFLRKWKKSVFNLEEILSEIISFVSVKDDASLLLTYTGHSNGGSVAAITALENSLLQRSGGETRAVISWGAPAGLYGNAVCLYNKLLGDLTLQIVHDSDSIARLCEAVLRVRRSQGALFIQADDEDIMDAHDRYIGYIKILNLLKELSLEKYHRLRSELRSTGTLLVKATSVQPSDEMSLQQKSCQRDDERLSLLSIQSFDI